MNIKTQAVKNVISNSNHISDYTDILNKLKAENEDLRQVLKHINSQKSPTKEVPGHSKHGFLEIMAGRIFEHFELEKDWKTKIMTVDDTIESIQGQ
jgi:hypothetical protein